MSLLDKKLSALLPGSRVRFTNLSGQVIEGIIAENDGKESLSVQVTSMATIRYDQIGMVDEYGQHTIVMQEPSLADNTVAVSVSAPVKVTEPAAEPKPLTTEVKPLTIEIKQLKVIKNQFHGLTKQWNHMKRRPLNSLIINFKAICRATMKQSTMKQ